MAKRIKKSRIYSALEVANICGVVNQTAINWIKNDYLEAFTTPGGQYRVYADDLVKFLNKRNMRVPDELAAQASKTQTKLSFLVIDDDEDLNNLMARQIKLEFDQAEIIQAYDGFDAGTKAAGTKPRVVILDLNLPGVDGRTICKNLKTDESYNNPWVIAISGSDDPQIRQKILEDGADAFFQKPVDMEELIDAVSQSKDVLNG